VTRRIPPALLLPAGLLVLYLAAPFLAGIQQVFGADWRGADVATLMGATGVSLASASLATLLIAIGGVPLGYALARGHSAGMRVLGVFVLVPLALPPLSSGVLLLFLLGAYAPLTQVLGDVTDSFAGVVLAEAFVAAPFLIIAARAAFESVDPVLEDVSATLGHGAAARFFRVALPLAWPGIAAGMLMCWLRAFGEFGATVLVAYHPYSLPVYTYVAFNSQGLPAMLPVLLPTLAGALGIIACGEALRLRRRRRPRPVVETEGVAVRPAPIVAEAKTGFSFRFRRAVPGFSLDVAWAPQGRRLAILGASGSGKSMTLRLLAGLERAEEAEMLLGNAAVTALPAERRGLGYVPQSPSLLPDRTLLAQFLFPVGAEPAAARRWIGRLGLDGLEDRLPIELSLGQQQRAALGRALMRPAKLLLLDEPFSALDAPLRRRMQQEVLGLQAELGLATLIVTHDPDEALLLADEILVIDHGHVLQAGPAATVFLRPADGVVARILGAGEVAEGMADQAGGIAIGGGIVLATHGLPVPTGAVDWTVRPEWLRPDPEGPYPGAIESILIAGPFADLRVRLGDAHLAARVPYDAALAPGPCRFGIDPGAIQVWPAHGVRPLSD
jgi:ABC-type Fe3+/spermidine/putrescine transport system ATPase subunit/ABC-type sulfate transport system permease component